MSFSAPILIDSSKNIAKAIVVFKCHSQAQYVKSAKTKFYCQASLKSAKFDSADIWKCHLAILDIIRSLKIIMLNKYTMNINMCELTGG